MFQTIQMKNVSNCCGCLCIRKPIAHSITDTSFFFVNSKRQRTFARTMQSRLILMNTFWGFDKPQALPPNFILTGPISKPVENLLELLKIKDIELSDWLDEAHAQN